MTRPQFNPWLVPGFGEYMTAVFETHWWRGRQLTTGDDVEASCPCQVCEDDRVTGRTQAWCTCTYGLYRVPDAPGPWIKLYRSGIRRPDLLTACFHIDRDCPHHGDAAVIMDWSEYPSLWDLTLTDDSERGHDADQA